MEIIDVRTLLPFDLGHTIVGSVKKTGALLVVDEDVPGGASAYILQQIVETQRGDRSSRRRTPRTLTARANRAPVGIDGDYFSKPSREDIFEAAYADPARAAPGSLPAARPRVGVMTEKSNVQAVHDTLLSEFRRDERYILMGEDVGVRGGVFRVSDGFIEEFGKRPHHRHARGGVVASSASRSARRSVGSFRSRRCSSPTSARPAFEQIVDEAARMRYRSNGA